MSEEGFHALCSAQSVFAATGYVYNHCTIVQDLVHFATTNQCTYSVRPDLTVDSFCAGEGGRLCLTIHKHPIALDTHHFLLCVLPDNVNRVPVLSSPNILPELSPAAKTLVGRDNPDSFHKPTTDEYREQLFCLKGNINL